MKLNYFIDGQHVSSVEYMESFKASAEYIGETRTTAMHIVQEDRQTARENGTCSFIDELGTVFEIRRN